jgi:serine/threonine-protein kinase
MANGLAEDLLDAALTEQRRDWLTGKRTPAADRLGQYPARALDPAQAAELVYHEFTLRAELGESPDWDSYLRQFPEHAATLQLLHQADQMVEEALAPAEPAPRSTAQVGDYELLEEIGHGGMGVVFRARQRSLDRIVAVKLMRTGEAGEEERKRFIREAQAVARLQHPNIVQIYEVGEAAGQPFFSLEYVEGQSLARRLDGTPMAARQAASLLVVLARAMDYAHGKGIVHRDLKPSNVLLAGTPETTLEQCTAKVTDFGLAKRLDSSGETGSGAVLGTPSYMAPEQAEPKTAAIDRRTDVYGLGAILYELLTGRPPFRAESPLQTLRQLMQADPALPRLLNPAVPRDLETVCLKCLEKDPRRRYPNAAALAEDLDRFLHGQPVRARPLGPLGRVWRWALRKPLAAALLLTLLIGLGSSLYLWRQSADNEARALANLREEELARQETEDILGMILQMLEDTVVVSETPSLEAPEANPVQTDLLLKADACYSKLMAKRGNDQKLQALSGSVLTRLGNHHFNHGRIIESLAFFEKATRLFEPLAPEGARQPEYLAAAVRAYFYLGSAYELQGRLEPARQAFATSLLFWQELARAFPNPSPRCDAFRIGLELAQVLQNNGHSEENIQSWFAPPPDRSELLGGAQQYDLFLDLLRVRLIYIRGDKSGQPVAKLAAAREASAILDRYYQNVSLSRDGRFWLAVCSTDIGWFLRRSGGIAEALHLLNQANRTLQELARDTPEDSYLFVKLSESWLQIGKAHWELNQVEETLDAYRHSLAAHRQACVLAPTETEYRRGLGQRYLQLGRKLCELGRLDEAEVCLQKRQALWPGDASKRMEAQRELRKWAGQVGPEERDLSPARLQERQRYLELCARLERNGVAGALPAGSAKR